MFCFSDPGHLNVNRASQLKGAGSSHQSSHSDGSQYSDVSQHSKRYRHRKQSRHSDRSRDSNQMGQGKQSSTAICPRESIHLNPYARIAHWGCLSHPNLINHTGAKLATRPISTITNNKVIFDKFCLSDYEIDQTPISKYSGRSFSEQSNRSSAHESSRTGPCRETDLRFPMDMASKYLSRNWYQKHK